LIIGVTTAATLWLATIIGLCLGGGQIALGLTALVLGTATLASLKWVELRIRQDRRGTLTMKVTEEGPSEEEIRAAVTEGSCWIISWNITYTVESAAPHRTIRCEPHCRGRQTDFHAPPFINQFAQRPGVVMVQWES
jgi:putative Mg2+ transporter-C (MgtC) family protein